MSSRRIAMGVAAARLGFGLGLAIAPRAVARNWLGAAVDAPGGTVAVRGLGARDAVLGIGVIEAVARGGKTRPWLMACALVDIADTAAALLAWNQLPKRSRIVTPLMAAAFAASGFVLAGKLAAETTEAAAG
jgi:hypothetical protein